MSDSDSQDSDVVRIGENPETGHENKEQDSSDIEERLSENEDKQKGESTDEEEDGDEEEESDGDKGDSEDDDTDGVVVQEIRKRRMICPATTNQAGTADAIALDFHHAKLRAVISYEDEYKIYKIENGALSIEKTIKTQSPFSAIVFYKGVSEMAGVVDDSIYTTTRNGKLKLVAPSRDQIVSFDLDIPNNLILFGTVRGVITVIGIKTRKIVLSVKLSEEPVTVVKFALNDYAIATAGQFLFTVSIPDKFVQATNSHAVDISCGCIQKNTFICGSIRGELVILELPKLTFRGCFRATDKASVTIISAVGDQQVAAGFDDCSVRLFSLFPHVEIGVLCTFESHPTQLVTSHDSQWLLATDGIGQCQLISLAEADTEPIVIKKRAKRNKPDHHLQSSSKENKADFFSAL